MEATLRASRCARASSIYVFDCGTGLRSLGQQLRRNLRANPSQLTSSYPISTGTTFKEFPSSVRSTTRAKAVSFFTPPRNRTLKRVMEEQMAAPYFPVDLSEMQAHRDFYDLEPGRVPLGDRVSVEAQWLNHPQGCMGFRLETSEEHNRLRNRQRTGRSGFDKNVRKLAAGADVLIYDAQYLPKNMKRTVAVGGTVTGGKPSILSWKAARKNSCCFIATPTMMTPVSTRSVQEARNYYPRGASGCRRGWR